MDYAHLPDAMVDIETLSTQPNAVVLSVGVCLFDIYAPEFSYQSFYWKLNPQWQQERHIDPGTVAWWMQQSDAARKAISEPGGLSMSPFIKDFRNRVDGRRTIWANDPDFDLTILRDMMKYVGMDDKWPFWLHRSCRTMREINPGVYKSVAFDGVAHNAEADAIHQAKAVHAVMRALRT